MPRAEAEALALQWKEARSIKDYATADDIRSTLRAVGIEAEDLAAELGRRRPAANNCQPSNTTEARAPPARGRDSGGAGEEARDAMPRARAEALALEWKEARSQKDYATADGIRATLRAVGIEAEDLYQEIEIFGLSESLAAHDIGDAAGEAAERPTPYEPPADDPLAYRDHMSSEARALFAPTEAAARHKDGGTGGLLTLNYQVIPDLPPDIGYRVTAGKVHASEEALVAYKRLQEEEAAAQRRQIAERNAQTLRARRA